MDGVPDHRRRFESFTPPPELQRSAPREVRLTGAGRALTVVAWLLFVAAVAAGVALQWKVAEQAEAARVFEQRGVETDALIDRVWRKSGDGKPAYAAYHFAAGGQRVNGETRMQLEPWRALRAGSVTRVRYLPEDPRVQLLAGARRGRLPGLVPPFVSIVFAAAAFLCGWAVRRERALLMEGRPAAAVVTKFSQHKSSHGGTHRTINYEFPLFGGGAATGRASVGKNGAAEGSTICVVYDPERPRRSQPYPFSLVTLDL